MKKSLLFLSVVVCATIFFACEDEEENKAFVGNWKSNMYPAVTTTGDTVLQQMTFEFTNSTFSDAIAQSTGLTDVNLVVQVTIGGTISNSKDTTLDATINTISLINGASADRTQDPTTFNTLFSATVGSLLMTEFSAKYSLYANDDSMKLFLPVKYQDITVDQTIRLGKQ